MKHLNFILAGLFFLCGLCCRAQVLPLEENVVLNTKEGQIKGKLLLPGGVKTCPVVLIIAGSGPTDMDGNSAIGNLRNNSLKFLAEGHAAAPQTVDVFNDDNRVVDQHADAQRQAGQRQDIEGNAGEIHQHNGKQHAQRHTDGHDDGRAQVL